MNKTQKTKSGWRILRRVLITLAILATLIAIFYTEEDWRGKRGWENCKRELEAKGAVLDWEKYIPPTVPDDQNFFKAPKMTDWFVKGHHGTELSTPLQNSNTFSVIKTQTAANDYLAWSDQFQPQFDQIREALKRPYTRMDGDYSQPSEIPIPNFVTMRSLVQVLEQRAKCYLFLGQPEKALRELNLLNDSRRITERAPMGQPMTLVDAMINVAITGLYVDTIAYGLQSHVWQEPQLVALQEQLKEVNLTPFVAQAFTSEPAAECRDLETFGARKFMFMSSVPAGGESTWQKIKDLRFHLYDLVPRGWVYQNMITMVEFDEKYLESLDVENDTISPDKNEIVSQQIKSRMGHFSPYNFLAAIAVPNFTKVWQTTAHNQTMVNEAQMACALERYRLAHGNYPETLDALVPQFIEKLPHDLIGGQPSQGSGSASQPLHYRRTEEGKFLLYSVGWNETDDGGVVAPMKDGRPDMENGDWVWKN